MDFNKNVLACKRFFLFLPILFLFNYNKRSDMIFEIMPKTSFFKIQHDLFKNGIQPFYGYLSLKMILSRNYKKIQPGEYQINKDDSISKIIRKMTTGDFITYKLTIPEGLTSFEIINLLNNATKLSDYIDEIPDEGFIFPTTIKYTKNTSRKEILNYLQNLMDKNLKELWENKSENCFLNSSFDVLILASIIEKETHIKEEKPIVASVFLNRLKRNMPLQADPTIFYDLSNKGAIPLKRTVLKNDLKIKSRYNTYMNKGLTPTPICCPGYDSIKAVVNPLVSNNLYFVVTGVGGHSFSDNYQSHLKNIKEWRKNE